MGASASLEEAPQSVDPSPDSFVSTAVLFAHKFTTTHPLFQWRSHDNVARKMSSRRDKLVFLVDFSDLSGNPTGKVLLSVVPATPFVKEVGTYKLKALLVSLRYPCLVPTLDVDVSKHCLLVAQPLVASGSLKDLIYSQGTLPAPYGCSYTTRRVNGRGLPLLHLSHYGHHVLQALLFLRSIGFVCEHLKSSNVLVDGGIARISDVFNNIASLERNAEAQRWTLPLEAFAPVDILLFGHLLFEMVFGRELNATYPSDSDLMAAPLDVADVLRAIFLAETPPAIPDLMSMALFAGVDCISADTKYLKSRLDPSMKATLKSAMQSNESRRQAYVHALEAKTKEDNDESPQAPSHIRKKRTKVTTRVSYRRGTSMAAA
ncbi:hypothetical protein Ae201684P_004970 [Aphanomyces euteiches]|uniref:Protein kinase domain-containing protein n=1 Tax=Aphanomyces euteiches TaxID=100861 RepID=A0A6G0XDJ5_9STRA|nr:hypothetical protein Ae201684_006159 [Aphanomyces euteiches]KAH9069284.1 hypothetical protein Ae201684P_004970 [Aphanomyces euteiches]KAH9134223.1 hypothetical protein AeRB84_019938 [Aphanomyces euteiches]